MVTRLPDRSFLGLGLKGPLFLARQPFILWPAIVAAVAWIAFAVWMTVANGPGSVQSILLMIALAPLLGFGAAALTTLPGFMLLRAFRRPTETSDDDRVIERVKANHFLGDEARGGQLAIGERALVFTPHRFNIQLDPRRIAMDEIRSVAWGIVVDGRGMKMSEMLEIETTKGIEVFVAPRAESLAETIEAQITSASAA